jgi:hypothetical protein
MAHETGASAQSAAERLCLSVFPFTPRGRDKRSHAGLTRIDPIQVWINAERRLMGYKAKRAAGS